MRPWTEFGFYVALLAFFPGGNHPVVCAEEPIEELKIGVINELTGPAAELGVSCSSGTHVAMQEFANNKLLNGVPVRLIMGDAHDDSVAALNEYKRMVHGHGVQIVLPVRSKSAMPINPLSERDKIVSIGIVGHSRFLDNPYAIRVYAAAGPHGEAYARHLSRLGKHRLALVSLEDEYALSLGQGFKAALSGLGQELVFDAAIPPVETDYAALIARLKRSQAEGLFVNLLGRSALFIKKAHEIGLKTQVTTSYWIQQKEQMVLAGKEALEGVTFIEVDSEKPLFRKRYQQAFPRLSYTPAAYLCYIAMAVALNGASQPGALYSPDRLRSAILGLTSVKLADGAISIINRETQLDLRVRVIKDGKIE